VIRVIDGTWIHKKKMFPLDSLLTSIRQKTSFHKVGALAVFVGVVRGVTSDGETVQRLKLEAYEEKGNEVLEEICEDLRKREGVIDVQIHHFVGEFDVGEDLVYVVVAGAHRQNVFPVLKEAVNRYKKEAPIFKKEVVIDGKGATKSRWISERETL